jgi:nitrite reductase (NADH) small subunit
LFVDVGALGDFPEASVKIVLVNRREIGLVHWHGQLYALRNLCPHQLGPLCRGLLRPRLMSAGGAEGLRVDEDMPVLACPWHGWEFEVKTGMSLAGHPYRVGTYPVKVEDGRVKIRLGADRGELQD